MRLPPYSTLARYSRDRQVILRAAFVIVALSALGALLASTLVRPQGPLSAESLPRSTGELLSWIRFGLPDEATARGQSCLDLKRRPWLVPGEVIEALLEDRATDPSVEPAQLLWRGRLAEDPSEAISRLEAIDPGLRHRQECLGDLHYLQGDLPAARLAYLAEAERFPEAGYARRSALHLARFEEDRPQLQHLLGDPSFLAATDPPSRIRFFAWLGDQGNLARAVFAAERELWLSPFLLPALASSGIWFLVLLSFSNTASSSWRVSLMAFALGIVSASLALHLSVVEEEIRGVHFQPDAPLLQQVLYFLSGAALREESLKLLCFAPLAFLLARKGRPLEMLVLAGITGLGFAFQENLAYYRQAGSGTFTAWERLLTANALHFSLSGVAGFACWQMLHRKGRGWEDFLLSFLIVVVAHALYNALLTMPVLHEYAALAPILVALIAYQYFDPLRQQIEVGGLHQRLSPLGIFVIGSALLLGGILVSSAATLPFRHALGAFAESVGAMLPLTFAFIGRFRDL